MQLVLSLYNEATGSKRFLEILKIIEYVAQYNIVAQLLKLHIINLFSSIQITAVSPIICI